MKHFKNFLFNINTSIFIFINSFYWVVPITWGIVIIYISPRFGSEYSPDSFAYYLIGKNITSGLGYVSQAVRDFYMGMTLEFYQPSRSFPPLMPILIGVFDKIFLVGISSGLFVNILILFGIFNIHFHFSKIIAGKYFWLIFLVLPFFILNNDSNSSFVAEIVSGRSIPLSVMIYSLILLIICSPKKISLLKSFLIGLLLGCMYLTRFDSLIFCIFLTIYLIIKKAISIRWISYGLCISIIPWLLRNIFAYGNPFASDNTITALSTYPSIVQISWFENIPLLKDNPNLWATQRLNYIVENIKIMIKLFIPLGGFFTILIFIIGSILPIFSKNMRIYIDIAWIWLLSNIIAISLTPYHDARYFSLSVFIVLVSCLLIIVSMILKININTVKNNNNLVINKIESKIQWFLITVFLIISLMIVNYFVKSKIKLGDTNSVIYKCLNDGFKEQIFETNLVAYMHAEHLAYYSNWKTIYTPLNITEVNNDFIAWSSKLKVSYIIVPEGSKFSKHPLITIKKNACGMELLDLTKLGKI